MFFEPVTVQEVVDIVMNLCCGAAAARHDGIRISIVKDCVDVVCEPLTKIINLSLLSCVVPTKMTIARVIPVHKSGDCNQFTNYRPVSVLPAFLKILEKAIYNRIVKYLSGKDILLQGIWISEKPFHVICFN